jgi:diphthamide synthase (EF-2-diphthine--ammonia ligase)
VLEPEALITTVTESYERISMHGVHRELLARQAEALGIPLVEVAIPPDCVNDVYDARMADAFATAPLTGVEAVAFGDLFLDDVRAYRDGRLAAAGKRGLFPLWGHDTAALARKFIDAGFEATLVCVDPRALDPAFCGRRYDERAARSAPARASTPAARTANSTPSSPRARSSPSQSPASAARSSNAMDSSSAT